MKKIINILFLLIFFIPLAKSQTIQGDSVIVLTPEEAKIITKMTEDLRYTKMELEICDSISARKDNIIALKEEIITRKDQIIKDTDKKKKKTAYKSFGLGAVIGLIIGLLIH